MDPSYGFAGYRVKKLEFHNLQKALITEITKYEMLLVHHIKQVSNSKGSCSI